MIVSSLLLLLAFFTVIEGSLRIRKKKTSSRPKSLPQEPVREERVDQLTLENQLHQLLGNYQTVLTTTHEETPNEVASDEPIGKLKASRVKGSEKVRSHKRQSSALKNSTSRSSFAEDEVKLASKIESIVHGSSASTGGGGGDSSSQQSSSSKSTSRHKFTLNTPKSLSMSGSILGSRNSPTSSVQKKRAIFKASRAKEGSKTVANLTTSSSDIASISEKESSSMTGGGNGTEESPQQERSKTRRSSLLRQMSKKALPKLSSGESSKSPTQSPILEKPSSPTMGRKMNSPTSGGTIGRSWKRASGKIDEFKSSHHSHGHGGQQVSSSENDEVPEMKGPAFTQIKRRASSANSEEILPGNTPPRTNSDNLIMIAPDPNPNQTSAPNQRQHSDPGLHIATTWMPAVKNNAIYVPPETTRSGHKLKNSTTASAVESTIRKKFKRKSSVNAESASGDLRKSSTGTPSPRLGGTGSSASSNSASPNMNPNQPQQSNSSQNVKKKNMPRKSDAFLSLDLEKLLLAELPNGDSSRTIESNRILPEDIHLDDNDGDSKSQHKQERDQSDNLIIRGHRFYELSNTDEEEPFYYSNDGEEALEGSAGRLTRASSDFQSTTILKKKQLSGKKGNKLKGTRKGDKKSGDKDRADNDKIDKKTDKKKEDKIVVAKAVKNDSDEDKKKKKPQFSKRRTAEPELLQTAQLVTDSEVSREIRKINSGILETATKESTMSPPSKRRTISKDKDELGRQQSTVKKINSGGRHTTPFTSPRSKRRDGRDEKERNTFPVLDEGEERKAEAMRRDVVDPIEPVLTRRGKTRSKELRRGKRTEIELQTEEPEPIITPRKAGNSSSRPNSTKTTPRTPRKSGEVQPSSTSPRKTSGESKPKRSTSSPNQSPRTTAVEDKVSIRKAQSADSGINITPRQSAIPLVDRMLPDLPKGETSGFRNLKRSVFQVDEEITGMSLPSLIDLVFELRPALFRRIKDPSITRAFWRTYYLFIPARDLLRELIRKFNELITECTEHHFPIDRRLVQRLDVIVRCWIKYYYYEQDDFRFSRLLEQLDKLLDPWRKELPNGPRLAAYYNSKMRARIQPPPELTPSFNLDVIAAFDQIALEPKEFSLQLSIFVHQWIVGLQPTEFFPAICKEAPLRFSKHLTSYHAALADFVQTTILYSLKKEARLGTLRYFIEVSLDCRARNDFFNLNIMLCALNSGPIQRLTTSLWSLDSKMAERLRRAGENIFPSTGFYRRLLVTLVEENLFFIPDLTFMMSDIAKIMENPTWLRHSTDSSISTTDTPLVNLDRLRFLDKLFHTLRASQKFRLAGWVKHDPATQNFLALLTRYTPNQEFQDVSYYARADFLESKKGGGSVVPGQSGVDKSSVSSAGLFDKLFK